MLNAESRQRLKLILPAGLLATKPWLVAQGLNPHFIDNAVKSQTLLILTPGVYVREASQVNWKGVVTSLQRMSLFPVHVGGLSALDQEGLAHYQSRSKHIHIELYAETALPAWLNKIDSNIHFEWHSTRRLWPASLMQEIRYLREDHWRESLPPLLYSTPEKAIIEALAAVPTAMSFEHADQLMQSLPTLSPKKVDALLRASSSIKSKRLFLWLSQQHNHAWFKYLKPEEYDLGVGKREIARGGRLDKTWNITVPRESN
jgi:hypothetical protein